MSKGIVTLRRVSGIGVSPVISVVIITATLLVILVISSFFAAGLLEFQVQNSEFEQAKTAMLLLDKTIVDVSLRRGAASSVQFNQRSGGIGLYRGEDIIVTISVSNHPLYEYTNRTYVIRYRGGRMVSAAEANLTNPGGLIIDSLFKPLGHVKIETGGGAWVRLDYNRVRVIRNNSTKTLEIHLIQLTPGRFGGSGTVTVRVQNKGIYTLYSAKLSGSLIIRARVGASSAEVIHNLSDVFTVRVVATVIEVSIM